MYWKKSTLHLIIEMQDIVNLSITVREPLVDGDKQELVSLVNQQTVIGEMKETMPFVGRHKHLYHGTLLLDDDRRVQDHLIPNESTLHVMSTEEIPLVIRCSEIQSQVIGIQPIYTVARVNGIVRCWCDRQPLLGMAKHTEITSSHDMFFNNSDLSLLGSRTISECSITAGSELLVVGPGEMPVHIRTRFTERFVCVKPTNTVQDLKLNISKCLCIPQERQRLVHNQEVIASVWKTLGDYHISSGATLYLAVTPDELDIHILLPSKQTLTLVCSLEETIEDIKLKIEQKEGIPVEHQMLPFDDDKVAISVANVRPGMLYHLRLGELYLCMV